MHDDKTPGPSQAPSGVPPVPPQPQQAPGANPHLQNQRDALSDKLGQPGALEVEDMPESSELMNRRQAMHNRVEESGAFEGSGDSAGGQAFGEDASFADMLKEANLSSRHLKFCCSGVVALLVLAAIIWGGWKGVQYLQDRPEKVDEPEIEEEVVEEESEVEEIEEEETSSSDDYRFTDPSIMAGILVGDDVAEDDPATEAGELVGEALVSEDALAQMILDFSEMYSAMEVDVVQLLDASRDRQDTLDNYLNQLNYLLYVGRQNTAQLEEDSENLVNKFNSTQEHKDELEERFFEELRELDAYGSVATLDLFIMKGEEIVQLRAQYQAREKLLGYYEIVMEAMERRVEDITLNEEALIKGVQVVDIEGSDIDLIIDENEL